MAGKMAKKYSVKWSAFARDDISEIIDYISLTSPGYAVKILDKIENQISKLDMFPERYRIVPELEKFGYLMYREVIVEYWRIIYKVENDLIYIMLIIDSRRNLEDILLKEIILRESEI